MALMARAEAFQRKGEREQSRLHTEAANKLLEEIRPKITGRILVEAGKFVADAVNAEVEKSGIKFISENGMIKAVNYEDRPLIEEIVKRVQQQAEGIEEYLPKSE